MTTETERFVVPKQIADPETGEVYFEKGQSVEREMLEAMLSNAELLKRRSSSLSGVYDALKAIYSEWYGRYGDVIDPETNTKFTMTGGGDADNFDIREMGKEHPQDVLELADRGFLTIKGAAYDDNMVKAALAVPGVHDYHWKTPKSMRSKFEKDAE